MMNIRHMLLAATLLMGAGGAALAQNAAVYDPNQLPATRGKVAQYSLTPRGDVDGLILTDGTEVNLPPHLGTQLVYAVRPGDAVTVRGVHARAIAMVQAMSIKNDATGATVVDNGPGQPPGPGAWVEPLTAKGHVKSQLHGPRGELNGALLDDGTIIRLPPPEANRLASDLTTGASLLVRGDGVSGALGRVIAARAIGPDAAHLVPVAEPRGPRPHHPPPGGPGLAPPAPPLDGPDAGPPPPADAP
jgi:hypothetical protein